MDHGTPREVPLRLAPATGGHRAFVRRLSAEVFSRFGDYDRSLPLALGLRDVRAVVAEQDGRPIGFAIYSLAQIERGEVDLLAIAVLPERQSRGVGRRLLRYVEEEARRRAAGKRASVRLNVAEDNERALRLFERAGYARVPGEHGRYPRGQRSLLLRKALAGT